MLACKKKTNSHWLAEIPKTISSVLPASNGDKASPDANKLHNLHCKVLKLPKVMTLVIKLLSRKTQSPNFCANSIPAWISM
jgi:hypothetical protein